ncbi:MAG: hypothetical protein ABUL66_03960 [Verrucomicrobiota bacterium]
MANEEQLKSIAAKLIWWQPPEISLQDVRRLVAQVMNLGSWEDVKFAQKQFGVAAFRDALEHSQPGWFEQDSWVIWHNAFELPVPEQARPQAMAGTPALNWRGQ